MIRQQAKRSPLTPSPMASKTPKTQGLRIPDDDLARLERISAILTRRALGKPVGIPTAIRVCMEAGLPRIEKRLGITPKEPTK
jgi:hypothetical protein